MLQKSVLYIAVLDKKWAISTHFYVVNNEYIFRSTFFTGVVNNWKSPTIPKIIKTKVYTIVYFLLFDRIDVKLISIISVIQKFEIIGDGYGVTPYYVRSLFLRLYDKETKIVQAYPLVTNAVAHLPLMDNFFLFFCIVVMINHSRMTTCTFCS
jgi:hypothetical protein